MSYQIKTPNVQYTGIREGIAIQDGAGKTEDVDTAQRLAALGYEVSPDPAAKKAPEKK